MTFLQFRPEVIAAAYYKHFGAFSADLGFMLEAADSCSAAR